MPNAKSLSRPLRKDLDGEAQGGRDFVRALAKGLAVIEAFDAHAPAMTLSEVARRVNLSRGTARRLLLTLVDLGYGGFDGKRFSLNPRILRLGFAYLSSQNLWQLSQPLMAALVEKVHESCSIAVLDGQEIVYVARVPTAARIMSINLGLGTRLPAFATSMGRVLLAGLPGEQLDEALKSAPVLTAYTAKTIHDKAALLKELEAVRKQGWAVVDQELEIGLRSIAAGITDANGRVIAALNIGTHASRWPMQKLLQEVLPALKGTATAISTLAARGPST